MQREVITFPGPGGSRVSCCIVPCGCLVLLLVAFFFGGVSLALSLRHRPPVAAVAPATPVSLPERRLTPAR